MSENVQAISEKHTIHFHWVPAHQRIAGNDFAHQLAQEATAEAKRPPSGPRTLTLTKAIGGIKERKILMWRNLINKSKHGAYTKSLDKASPYIHTKMLYNILFCPIWTEQRKRLRETAQGDAGDLSLLVGGWEDKRRDGILIHGPPERWRPNIALKATIAFVKETRRFDKK